MSFVSMAVGGKRAGARVKEPDYLHGTREPEIYWGFCMDDECPTRLAQGKDYVGFGTRYPARFCPACRERRSVEAAALGRLLAKNHGSRYVGSVPESIDRDVA
jgi:hypothetical protein